MTRVSKNRLQKNNEERIKRLFVETFAELNNKTEMAEFLNDFLTPTEKVMLAKRLAVAVLLLKKYSYISICKILKVSMGTVNNVNLWITHQPGGFKKQVEKILEKEKKEKT